MVENKSTPLKVNEEDLNFILFQAFAIEKERRELVRMNKKLTIATFGLMFLQLLSATIFFIRFTA